MIEQLTPATRKRLVACRILGVQGHVGAALNDIDSSINDCAHTTLDRVHLLLLAAELLYLDYRDQEALVIFERDLRPLVNDIPSELRIVVLTNENDIKSALFHKESTAEFYRLVDEQRQLGLSLSDAAHLLLAEDAAAAGKHYEALPLFWGEIVRTYKQGSWRACRRASRRFAEECRRIGVPHEGAYHAILAQDADLAGRIGAELVLRRDPRGIANAVERTLATANLERHFAIACKMVEALADVISDEQIPSVFAWLSPHCQRQADTLHQLSGIAAGWGALEAVAHRLGRREAGCAVDLAVNHPLWKRPRTQSVSLVGVIGQCMDQLPTRRLSRLADEVLCLITDGQREPVYADALALLCHIARRIGPRVRARLARRLFPRGAAVNMLLAQVAPLFDKELGGPEHWAEVCNRAVRNLRLVVQCVPKGQKPEKVSGSYGRFSRSDEEGTQLVVHFADTTALEAILAHRKMVPRPALRLVIEAAVEMIANDENLLVNRTSLTSWMNRALPFCSRQWILDASKTLAPIALGSFREPSAAPKAADADDPLNRNRIRTGTPGELQGIALLALARCASRLPKHRRDEVHKLLHAALAHADPVVRRFALSGMRVLGGDLPFAAVLMGTADSDPSASALAFDVFAARTSRYSARDSQLLLIAIQRALNSTSVRVRRSAAGLVAALNTRNSRSATASEVERLHAAFNEDISWSVRQAALGHDNDAGADDS